MSGAQAEQTAGSSKCSRRRTTTSCFPGVNTVQKCVINGVSMAALSSAEQAAGNSNTSMLECRDSC